MGVICPNHTYGEHILLECPLCGAQSTTKNIDYIGARGIFPKGEECECGMDLIHTCSGKPDWLSLDQTLAMYRRQDRDLDNVEYVLERDYGKRFGGKLTKRYKEMFEPLTTEAAGEIEATIYEHREGFTPGRAEEQARQIIEEIGKRQEGL